MSALALWWSAFFVALVGGAVAVWALIIRERLKARLRCPNTTDLPLTPTSASEIPPGTPCPRCGYDLAGITSAVCPECGKPTEREA